MVNPHRRPPVRAPSTHTSRSSCSRLDMSYEVEAGVGGGGAGGDGVDGGDRRGYFTPLWQTKGAQSFGGGLLQAVPGAWMAGDVPGSNFVESEGFVPLRKVRTTLPPPSTPFDASPPPSFFPFVIHSSRVALILFSSELLGIFAMFLQ